MKKNILFIINPISGGTRKLNFPALANSALDLTKFDARFVYTQSPNHANELALEAIQNNIDIIVAVGGDGTINEIASAVESTDKIMAIVPYGSGNGLARSLKIPLNVKNAVSRINNLNARKIDSGVLNGKKFFNVAGIGFDAHISSKFSELKNRGLKGYIGTTLSEISSYRSENYNLTIDGNQLQKHAFMISIANSCQYGNNAFISPEAELDDGLLDVCIIKPFPLVQLPLMGYHLFNKTAHKTNYVEIIKGRKIRISRPFEGIIHLDGEPVQTAEDILITVKPLSLTILN